jgi:hypothetical protein
MAFQGVLSTICGAVVCGKTITWLRACRNNAILPLNFQALYCPSKLLTGCVYTQTFDKPDMIACYLRNERHSKFPIGYK